MGALSFMAPGPMESLSFSLGPDRRVLAKGDIVVNKE